MSRWKITVEHESYNRHVLSTESTWEADSGSRPEFECIILDIGGLLLALDKLGCTIGHLDDEAIRAFDDAFDSIQRDD